MCVNLLSEIREVICETRMGYYFLKMDLQRKTMTRQIKKKHLSRRIEKQNGHN